MNKLIPALIFVSTSAVAATFDERVDKANAAFETEQGEIYEKKLRPFIPEIIKKCANAGSGGSPGKFVLVADVSPDGKVFNPAVMPETKNSLCFSGEFSARILPAPPNSLISEGFAPLVVEVYIVK